MKDKVEQRERTEALVGGARTFNEFVKEKAIANNITPACVRSLPEVKEEWKQIKEREKAEKKSQSLAKKAETKAQKKALSEAKKAEKKAVKKATKASAEATAEVRAEKTAIKKVAKKADANAENIKMILIDKAHSVSQAVKEPKVKGRPKKYATAEEARRAKIEQTKVINRAKKEAKKAIKSKSKKQEESDEEDSGIKWQPDVFQAELKVYGAKTHAELDAVIKIIRRVFETHEYEKLDADNKRSFDHTIKVYNQKRNALLQKERDAEEEEDRREREETRKRKEETKRIVKQNASQSRANIEMFKKAKMNKKKHIPELEEGEIYEGRGFDPSALKEFGNYGKIQEHLGQHLNDLKEAIDPKDLRDFIYFTKEKARLKNKLVGGLVRMIGGELSSDSSSEEMEGGESLGFLGNIKRAFTTSWNKPVQSDAERKVLDATLNYFEPAVLTPLSYVAPPVAKIGEAQRQLMKSKTGV